MTSSILTKYGSNKSSHQYIAVKKQNGERQVLNGIFSIYRGRRLNRFNPVSYTHLDVYKRQVVHTGRDQGWRMMPCVIVDDC